MYSVDNICDVNNQKQIMVVNNNANENILLIGSCRITPFLNYMLNHDIFGNKFNYLCIMVHIPQMKILSEDIINNDEIKNQIYRCKYLFGEYIKNFNYFNTQRNSEKNIFHIYNSFQKEIIIPNWQDICLYSKDLINYKNLKNDFINALHGHSHINDFAHKLKEEQQKEINRYINILEKANFLELKNYFLSNIPNYRLAFTLNHPTNLFFIEVYRIVIEKYFTGSPYHFPESVLLANQEDFLSNCYNTKLTFYDYHYLNIRIPENYLDQNESIQYILN